MKFNLKQYIRQHHREIGIEQQNGDTKIMITVSAETINQLNKWLDRMTLSAQLSTAIDYAIECAGYDEPY